MKKLAFAACIAIAVAAFTSCGNGTPKANLKDEVDTLSYAIGMAQSDGLKQYLSERMGIDTAYIDDFIKGLNEGATAGDDKKKAAYYAGIQIGQQLGGQMLQGINYEVFGNDSTKSLGQCLPCCIAERIDTCYDADRCVYWSNLFAVILLLCHCLSSKHCTCHEGKRSDYSLCGIHITSQPLRVL